MTDRELMFHFRHDLRLNIFGLSCRSCQLLLEPVL